MKKSQLLKYLLENNANVSTTEIVISMAITVLLSLFVYWVYKKTYSGVMYSKNFNVTIMLVSLVTSMVIMVIGSNLALSLGMVGALSIIRFRTAVKDPKDIGFLFWGVSVGLATGTGIYIIGIVGSLFIAFVLFLIDRGMYNDNSYLLIIKGEDIDLLALEEILKMQLKRHKLKMKTFSKSFMDVTYEIDLGNKSEVELINNINALGSIKNINIVAYNGEIAG